MKSKRSFTIRDIATAVTCVGLLLANIAAIGAGGRRRAKEAVCLSNLRQWGVIWKMYTDNNNGYFVDSVFWVDPLRSYYKSNPKIRCCPMAAVPQFDAQGHRTGARHPFAAWGIWNGTMWRQRYEADYGSYGMNGWVCNPPPHEDSGGARLNEYLWRTPHVRGAAAVPLFADCHTYENMTPSHIDTPPQYDGDPITGNSDEMRLCCTNRHNGAINMLFLDFSARKVGLKELWLLKWHRSWPKNVVLPVWPEWMRDFKDY